MRISDWSSDVCPSELLHRVRPAWMPCPNPVDALKEGARGKHSHVLDHDFGAAFDAAQALGRLFRGGAFGPVAGDLRPHDGEQEIGFSHKETGSLRSEEHTSEFR